MYHQLISITLILLASCSSICHAQRQCEDDPFFTFGSYTWVNQNGESIQTLRTCEWISTNNSETRIANWCDYVTVLGATVRNKCQDACNVCTPNLATPDPARCINEPFPTTWKDTAGRTCAFYEQGNNCIDEAGRDPSGKSHTQACCGCNGGCYDQLVGIASNEEWYDEGGPTYNCAWYAAAPDRCAIWGRSYRNFGKVADEVCCVCGAGERPGLGPNNNNNNRRTRNLESTSEESSSSSSSSRSSKSRVHLRSKRKEGHDANDRNNRNDRNDRV